MSASLVGSEMCIRDRPPDLATPRLRGFAASRLRGHAASRLRGFATFRPVSYTHLTLPTICSV
eukprot:14997737-Alexandrium_andersonii.AAC.1